jgi:hypothetical protein
MDIWNAAREYSSRKYRKSQSLLSTLFKIVIKIILRNDCFNFQVYQKENRCCLFATRILQTGNISLISNKHENQSSYFLKWKLYAYLEIVKFLKRNDSRLRRI